MSTTFGFNTGYVEELYAQYLENPESVSARWREFFADYNPGPTFHPPHPTTELEETMVAPPARPQASGDGAAAEAPVKPVAREIPQPQVPTGATEKPLKGPAARIVENMEASLDIPTATSARQVAVKLMAENRRLINKHQQTIGGEKVSFTHLIAYAIVQSLLKYPAMNYSFRRNEDGSMIRVENESINLGLAIDMERRGQRSLLVPNIRHAEVYSFPEFLGAYNDVVRRARDNRLEVSDFQETTATLTNPGMIGTVMSVPRLMPGQGLILAVGAIEYPAHYQSLPEDEIARLGISQAMTITSTYDHRVIQGAESGEFLAHMEELISGKHSFYEQIFHDLGITTLPLKSSLDTTQVLGPRDEWAAIEKNARVLQLIRAYRVRGHLLASTNPLGDEKSRAHDELDPASYGLTIWDLDRIFYTGGLGTSGGKLGGKERLALREILDILWETYTRHVGIEFMHISDPVQKRWLIERIEPKRFNDHVSLEQKHRILEKLNSAEAFERFIHTKYIGHKRFSLEGAETLIPILDQIISDAADQEVKEVLIGMAHRGRLNVLANILGKPYSVIFSEFEGPIDIGTSHGSGDVKYHLGSVGKHVSPNGSELRLTLAANPSHLEAVNPVVEGMARAMQEQRQDVNRDDVVPILIHGDAAFAGQGVVAETLNLSQLDGYKTGGTLHVVVNNQIGFTTLPMHARSSVYATDIARMIQAPIFHVNGDDPEAAIRVARLALDFRQVFKKDVVIDMVCYRKHGHNEGDEPSYTQPLMYSKIKDHRSVRMKYTELLLRRGDMDPEAAEKVLDDFHERLQTAFEETRELVENNNKETPDVDVLVESPVSGPLLEVDTRASHEHLDATVRALTTNPDGFNVHSKLARLLARKQEQFENGKIDWAFAESLAFGALLQEGTPVRLSGQDSARGTFSQRHSMLYDQEDGSYHIPLNNLAEGQAKFQVFNSLLSEYAALGFEYGYSVASPETLVLWEAQFGDFVNGAQIMIDQFITAAEEKWNQKSSLVMLLPHGYEGQGPEHSSARLERFLQQGAEENMIVANFTTPANYFHALRRQMKRGIPKPLVIMTPKSLLRHPQAVSTADELENGQFNLIYPGDTDPAKTRRIVFCTGKVYYDALAAREEKGLTEEVAIVRVEQLYPFPKAEVKAELERYGNVHEVIWLQEEPRNMGAWMYIESLFDAILVELRGNATERILYAGRHASASPATGSASRHAIEQEAILRVALGKE